MRATLPMYALPEMADANAAFWHTLAGLLRAEGVEAPVDLSPSPLALPAAIVPETLFSQMCGYPLLMLYPGQYRLLGAPLYDLPGCKLTSGGVPTHRSFLVVREEDEAAEIAALRGSVFAMNGRDSNSGMNLPRALFAPLADGHAFFGSVTVTGSHMASLAAVQSGVARSASIDCVTYGFAALHRQAAVAGLRILAETAASPAIPFIASATTSETVLATLRRILTAPESRGALAPAMAALRIRDIRPVAEADYAAVGEFERAAVAAGYPILA